MAVFLQSDSYVLDTSERRVQSGSAVCWNKKSKNWQISVAKQSEMHAGRYHCDNITNIKNMIITKTTEFIK